MSFQLGELILVPVVNLVQNRDITSVQLQRYAQLFKDVKTLSEATTLKR